MIDLLSKADGIDTVVVRAADRDLLPTPASGRDTVAAIKEEVIRRSVWSARTTNATYLQGLRERINKLLSGGLRTDFALMRLELKRLLAELGYDPETGFPGDDKLGVPPAEPGSLLDLSSDRRLNLILRTQVELMRGAEQKRRGLSRAHLFPAWELVRISPRRVPRDWDRRWIVAGGPVVKDASGRIRLGALKTHDVWNRIGSRELFDDALDTDHSPFAFNSGRGLVEVDFDEWQSWSHVGQADAVRPEDVAAVPDAPAPRREPPKVDPDFLREIQRERATEKKREGGSWAERLERYKAETAREVERQQVASAAGGAN